MLGSSLRVAPIFMQLRHDDHAKYTPPVVETVRPLDIFSSSSSSSLRWFLSSSSRIASSAGSTLRSKSSNVDRASGLSSATGVGDIASITRLFFTTSKSEQLSIAFLLKIGIIRGYSNALVVVCLRLNAARIPPPLSPGVSIHEEKLGFDSFMCSASSLKPGCFISSLEQELALTLG